jgi:hypothetical protein
VEGYENADLDVLNTGAEDVLRWDREWARHFSVGPSSWFTNLAWSTDRMAQFKEELRGLTRGVDATDLNRVIRRAAILS